MVDARPVGAGRQVRAPRAAVDQAVDHPAHEVRCFLVTTMHGPAWDETQPIREQPGWEAHAAFMDGLVTDGVILLGGPLGDGARTAHVVDAPSEAHLRRRFGDDPWAGTGQLRIDSVQPWRIWLGEARLGSTGRPEGTVPGSSRS